MIIKVTKDLLSRFWSYVEDMTNKSGEDCWNWVGQKNWRGYGRLWLINKNFSAHILSYLLFKGNIDGGLLVCHSCDNPSCINPWHLFIGNQSDNLMDCVKKVDIRLQR